MPLEERVKWISSMTLDEQKEYVQAQLINNGFSNINIDDVETILYCLDIYFR